MEFNGSKSGVGHDIQIHDDRRLVKIVRQCQELPGQQLFQYVDRQGEVRDIGSDDVNQYLKEISGQDFTAKDFPNMGRHGVTCRFRTLQEFEDFDTEAAAKRNITRAIERVAKLRLGNTKAVLPEMLYSSGGH